MDVDDVAAQLLAQGLREDLHVAREHDELHAELVHEPQQLGLRLRLGVLGDGDAVEGDAVELRDGPQVLMVAHHADDVDRQPLAAGAEEQVGEAVGVLAHHDEGAQGAIGLVELPLHRVDLGELGQVGLHLASRHAGEHRDAYEEQARLLVPELRGLGDVPAAPGQRPRDRVDDAGAVRAGQGEHEMGGGGGGGRRRRGGSRRGHGCSHTAQPTQPRGAPPSRGGLRPPRRRASHSAALPPHRGR